MFEAAGCAEDDARAVVDHLVESDLFGLTSHGSMRYFRYAHDIRVGTYNAKASPRIERETSTTAVIDGDGALGPIGATFATKLAIDKARQLGLDTESWNP